MVIREDVRLIKLTNKHANRTCGLGANVFPLQEYLVVIAAVCVCTIML